MLHRKTRMVTRRPEKKLLKKSKSRLQKRCFELRWEWQKSRSGVRFSTDSEDGKFPWFDDRLGMKNEGKANISVWSLSSGKKEIAMN